MMGNISNFARQDTVSVVEFADYLRECLPPVQWPEAEAERDTWRQRLPYSLVVTPFYPQPDFAERRCRHTFRGRFGEYLQQQSDYPACFEPLPHCRNGRWRTRRPVSISAIANACLPKKESAAALQPSCRKSDSAKIAAEEAV